MPHTVYVHHRESGNTSVPTVSGLLPSGDSRVRETFLGVAAAALEIPCKQVNSLTRSTSAASTLRWSTLISGWSRQGQV